MTIQITLTCRYHSLRVQRSVFKGKGMTKTSPAVIAALAAALLLTLPAQARRDDQGGARADQAQGTVKSLREIEAGIIPQMRGMQYLGPEYDQSAKVYRLKFINKDRVIFVDVDARTGGIIRQH
jgi:uncharacterized membrane protein YkoI